MADALLLMVGGLTAGVFGSLLGLGGGLLIVPLLVFVFHLSLIKAIGISLVCVIVTSSAAAGVYLERRVANLRLGMTLELFTAAGALVGGLLAFALDERVIAALFAFLLVYTAASMLRRSPEPETPPAAIEGDSAADPTWRSSLDAPGYHVKALGPGSVASVGAGVVSALLGVGGGIVKVPVMHLIMGVPLRVATATSNLMIGVTASAGAVIYLSRGEIEPLVAGPTALGVFAGATVGSRTAHRIDVRILKVLFVVVLLYTAFQMLRRAVGVA